MICPKIKFSAAPEACFKSISKFGGDKFNSVGLYHSGSQPSNYDARIMYASTAPRCTRRP